MGYFLADNITSPLGFSTRQNYERVLNGETQLKSYNSLWNLPYPVVASLFTQEQKEQLAQEYLTWFESVAFCSAKTAIENANNCDKDFDVASARTVFILSTTKANVAELESNNLRIYPSEAAQAIANRLGFNTAPIVVDNACISGLSALIIANRLLLSGFYDYAVVCGCDVQSDFIVSGFQSFKALSSTQCKPFDIERTGLNLGEAAATIVLSAKPSDSIQFQFAEGNVKNDAYHISAPAKKGDGLFLSLSEILSDVKSEEIAFVNAHGTATLFNDPMEAAALRRAALNAIPINAFKGYYGHTMGASGVLETILCAHSLTDNIAIGTKGFNEIGVSGNLKLSYKHQTVHGDSFIKMLSGFGGCNASIFVSKKIRAERVTTPQQKTSITHRVHITPYEIIVDGNTINTTATGSEILSEIYKEYIHDYPKYYKMDGLSRLGFIASELLLSAENGVRFADCNSRAVILFNHSSSIDSDRKYLATISNRDEFYPSPSHFVYTLPNIVTGEIAIRNHYHGETCLYVLHENNQQQIGQIIESSFQEPSTESMISGWLNYEDSKNFEADLYILQKQQITR